MLTKEYILDNMKKYCKIDTNTDLCLGNFYDLVISPLEKANCFKDYHMSYDNGLSKGVIIFDELDYVIKIPFVCSWYEEETEWDEEKDECVVICEGGPSGYPFGGVEVEGYCFHNDWDHCETELYRYCEAEKSGLEEHFAKIWFLDCINGWPIYAQSKACMYNTEDSYSSRSRKHYTDKERATANAIQSSSHFYIAQEWMMDFIQYWGKDKLLDFIKFCDEWFIDDLHDGNIGYICGVPCLVDYGSFSG